MRLTSSLLAPFRHARKLTKSEFTEDRVNNGSLTILALDPSQNRFVEWITLAGLPATKSKGGTSCNDWSKSPNRTGLTPTLVTTDPAPTVLPRPTHTSKNSRTATNPNVILDIYLLSSLGAFQTTPHGGVHWVSCPVQANIRTEQCILPDHDELCVEDEKIEIPLADFEV